MAVHVFGCNHVVLEVGDLDEAIKFYTDVSASWSETMRKLPKFVRR